MARPPVFRSLIILVFAASTCPLLEQANAPDSGTFTEFNVLDYGAVGDGETNDSKHATSTLHSFSPRPLYENLSFPSRPPLSLHHNIAAPRRHPIGRGSGPPDCPPYGPSTNLTAKGYGATGTSKPPSNSSEVLERGGSDSSSNSSDIVESGVSSNTSDVIGSNDSNSTIVDSPPDDSSSSGNTSDSPIDTSENSTSGHSPLEDSSASSNASDVSTDDSEDSPNATIFSDNTSNNVGTLTSMTEFSVLKYGALGDGETDDTQAFADAWTAACAMNYAYVNAPSGYKFLVYPTRFKGPCLLNMTFMVDGTVMAPADPAVWSDSSLTNHWLKFSRVSVIIEGIGTFDGQGQTWWANSCKTNSKNPCVDGPTALVFDTCTNVTVKYVSIINAQQMHLSFQKSSVIQVNGINISAPGNSPNTDGIHVQTVTNVTIEDSYIGTGDDCVSIQNGSVTVTIKNITCGPGHGISIGGLGKKNTSATVSDILVDGVDFTNSTNGVRIKSWQGSSGTAKTLTFQNLRMNNVKNPILIDQYYCDYATSGSCPNFTSNVVISEITYKNITGTSATSNAIKLACSETVPCTGITLQDISLLRPSGSEATSFCTNAFGTTENNVIPSSCLQKSS